MNFSCDNCSTRYTISDHKVRGKILKIRCKQCNEIIVLKEIRLAEKSAETSGQAAAQISPARPRDRTETARAGDVGRAPSDDWTDAPTEVASHHHLEQLLAGLQDEPEKKTGKKSPAPDDDVVWYISVKGQQSPPLSRPEIERKIRDREVTPRAYAWNQNLENWTRLSDLPDFKAALSSRRESKSEKKRTVQESLAERKRRQAHATRQPAVAALGEIAAIVETSTEPTGETGSAETTPKQAVGGQEGFEKGLEKIEKEARDKPGQKAQEKVKEKVKEKPGQKAQERLETGPAPAPKPAKVEAETGEAIRDEPAESEYFDPWNIKSLGEAQIIVKHDERPPGAPGVSIADPPPTDVGEVQEPLDPFAMVADKPTPPGRENTRMFLRNAGLANRARKQKIYASVGGAAALVVVGGVGLDLLGWINVPFLHQAVETVRLVTIGEPAIRIKEAETELTTEEKQALRRALLTNDTAAARAIRARAEARRIRLAAREITVRGRSNGQQSPDPASPITTTDTDPERHDPDTELVDIEKPAGPLDGLRKTEVKLKDLKNAVGPVVPTLQPDVSGGLTEQEISAVVLAERDSIKVCADREAKYGEKLPPSLPVTIDIDPTGVVSFVKIRHADHTNSAFGRCIRGKLRSWRFPSFSGEAMSVEIPLKFTSVF